MSSPFDENRPGRSGGEFPTDQWRPVDGEAWSNVGGTGPGTGSGPENPWSTAGGPSGGPGGGRSGGNPLLGGGAGGYPGGPGGYPGGPQGGYPGGQGGYPGGPGGYPSGPYPPMGGDGSGGGNGAKIALIILLAVLLIGAGGALGYYFLAERGNGESGTTAQPAATSTVTRTPETSTRGRAEGFVAPSSWSKCGGSGEPGDLNLYYAGTSSTSCPFTKAVRDALVDHYNSTDQLDVTVSAYSPVTGRTYSMSCTDDGDYVTCRGGNNAVVHIV